MMPRPYAETRILRNETKSLDQREGPPRVKVCPTLLAPVSPLCPPMEFLASALSSFFPLIYHHTQPQTTAERKREGEGKKPKNVEDGDEEKNEE